MGIKFFSIRYNVGKVKYLVSFHDGIKKHKDGSPFYDIALFKNKKRMQEFIKELKQNKYIER